MIQKKMNINTRCCNRYRFWLLWLLFQHKNTEIMTSINSHYDQYTREEKKLNNYRQKGWFYKNFVSLLCQKRKNYHKKQVLLGYMRYNTSESIEQLPVLSGRFGVIVSLTSFPPRIPYLHLMLESILLQTVTPQKIIVWLSEQEFPQKEKNLTKELQKLIKNGIEYRFVSDNLRSHKKYYYVFKEFCNETVITVDDDIIYPRDTISRLLELSYRYPNSVCSNIVRQIKTLDKQFLPYKEWEKISSSFFLNSFDNIAIGCGGVLYFSKWYGEELFDKKLIRVYAFSVDDLWLKANQLKQGVRVVCGGGFFPRPIELPSTQKNSLQRQNNSVINHNDKQWASLNLLWNLYELFESLRSKNL